MPKLQEKYETMVVYSLKNGEEHIEGLKSKFSTLIESNATSVSVNEWGKRRLAYPINYENEGYYVLYGFDSKPDFPMELERILNITEGVLRFLTVLRQEAPAKEESKEENPEETEKEPEEAPDTSPPEEDKEDDSSGESGAGE